MDTGPLVLIIIAAVVVILLAVILNQRRKTQRLRSRFGPEYDRLVVQEHGRSRRAEAILENREKRVQKLHIRHLTPLECTQFTSEWRIIQEQFVDDPTAALRRAEALLQEALRARGYPMSNYDDGIADISVAMPRVVSQYRTAHEIGQRDGLGNATTEELRRAMQLYREAFEGVLEANSLQPVEVHR